MGSGWYVMRMSIGVGVEGIGRGGVRNDVRILVVLMFL